MVGIAAEMVPGNHAEILTDKLNKKNMSEILHMRDSIENRLNQKIEGLNLSINELLEFSGVKDKFKALDREKKENVMQAFMNMHTSHLFDNIPEAQDFLIRLVVLNFDSDEESAVA